jgi:osmotically-inducible protein OsmY
MNSYKRENMKSFLILATVIICGFLTETLAQTDTNSKIPTREIEQKVMKKLLRLPHYGVFDLITFKVDGDTVILSGKVAEARNKKDAENAIEDVKGVESVKNNIEILPLSSFDNSIRVRLFRTFVRQGGIFRYVQGTNPLVRLIVEGGNVTLEGYVTNLGDYNLMNILANSVTNVFSVKNNLVIAKEQIR